MASRYSCLGSPKKWTLGREGHLQVGTRKRYPIDGGHDQTSNRAMSSMSTCAKTRSASYSNGTHRERPVASADLADGFCRAPP
ncbi:hypothetical protein GDO78_015732 [Eleutherodactylus coqui]|uniref:Uncharacterized protein n=1 Tax=Eleutherodactylus coqui TaxID=57060 RepID=A0A8J6EDD4_ELECQ|nr:hypothetical protein GDO78_015732 [Eleutherodactylus coqui]